MQDMAGCSEAENSRHVHVFRRQSVCDGCSSSFSEPQPTYDEYDDAQFVAGNSISALLHFSPQIEIRLIRCVDIFLNITILQYSISGHRAAM